MHLLPQSRSCLRWSWTCRQTQEASRWTWYGWWAASSPNQSRQIPSGILWEGRHAILPQATESILEAGHQSRQGWSWSSLTLGVLQTGRTCSTTRAISINPFTNLRNSQLWSLIPQDKRDEYLLKKKSDTAPVLDLLPLGYSKVLGKGRLPEIPLVVRARFFSREAERKIKDAGGVTELVA